jgi:hypothetical protein
VVKKKLSHEKPIKNEEERKQKGRERNVSLKMEEKKERKKN